MARDEAFWIDNVRTFEFTLFSRQSHLAPGYNDIFASVQDGNGSIGVDNCKVA